MNSIILILVSLYQRLKNWITYKIRKMPTTYDPDTVKTVPSSMRATCIELADLVEDIVRFGSHVLKWASTEDQQDPIEKLAFLAILRHTVELLDTIPDNLRKEEISGVQHTLRSLLDVCFSMLYLVQDDTSRRVRAYLYMDTIRKIKILKRQDPSTSEYTIFVNAHANDRILRTQGEVLPAIDIVRHREKIRLHEVMLSNGFFLASDTEYKRMRAETRSRRRPFKPDWYSFYNGATSIRELADKVNLLATYETFFRRYSGKVHPSDLINHAFTATEAIGFQIKPIRRSGNITEVAGFACQIGKEVLKAYVDKFIPSRSTALSEWYQNQILNPYIRLRSQITRS